MTIKKIKETAAAMLVMSVALVLISCANGSNNSDSGAGNNPKSKETVINLWSFTDEVPGIVEKYMYLHPDVKFKLNTTIANQKQYEAVLDAALKNGEVDIYTTETKNVMKYTQGDMAKYAATYDSLGINTAKAITDAEIAQYTVDIGTNKEGKVVGLGYQSTAGCFIYRRSVAKKVFGTDDPESIQGIIGGGTDSWNKLLEDSNTSAASKLASAGVAVLSGDGDLWQVLQVTGDKGWIVDNKLYMDPAREDFIDYAKLFHDGGRTNLSRIFTTSWTDDMNDNGAKPCFGFFGPAWLINYTIAQNCVNKYSQSYTTFGDWAICKPPVGFYWGGTWIHASKLAEKDNAKKEVIKKLIEWITLDTSEDGLMYQWASGTFQWRYGKGAFPSDNIKDTVCSATVMKKVDGSIDILKGQNMFDYYIPANQMANGKNLTIYDSILNEAWYTQVKSYVNGEKTREQAIADFKETARSYGIATE